MHALFIKQMSNIINADFDIVLTNDFVFFSNSVCKLIDFYMCCESELLFFYL